ncbi:MAG: hypothetical protein ABL995_20535 [Bryobacteraceae bacterium]
MAFSVAIASAEVFFYSAPLKDTGLQSWEVGRVRYRAFSLRPLDAITDFLFRYPNVLALHAIRLLAAVLLLTNAAPGGQAIWDFLIVLLFWALYLRCPYGWDGSDQMTVVVLLPLGLAHLIDGPTLSGNATRIALAFIAAQLCVAYLSAGVWKLVSPVWRNEPALTGILHTRSYGAPAVARLLDGHATLSCALGWGVMVVETLFPLVFVVPRPAQFAFLAVGLGFHLGTAVLMGLNTFFWSFAAAYPALLYWLR